MLVADRVRALVLVILAGCFNRSGPNYIRYAELPARPADARAAIAARAAAAGMTEARSEDDTDHYVAAIDRKDVEGSTRRYRGDDGPPVGFRQSRYLLTARAESHRGGSLVELTGPTTKSLDLLWSTGRTYHVKQPRLLSDGIHPNLTIDAGFARAPHTQAWGRVDAMASVVFPVWSRGGEGVGLEARHRISIVAGGGVAIDDHIAVKPELGLMFDRQDASTPYGRLLEQGYRKAVTLAFSAPIGEDFVAYEAGVTLHVPPFGGIFGRVGYETGERSGVTYMAGMRLDAQPTLGVYALIAAGLIGYAIDKHVDWGDLLKCKEPCKP